MSVDRELLRTVSASTVALGYLRGTPLEWKHDPVAQFEIQGTGFVIAPGVVLTTRHTINALKDIRDNGTVPPTALRVGFILPESSTRLTLIVAELRSFGSTDHVDYDLGIVNHRRSAATDAAPPLSVGEHFEAHVTDDVFCVGFPGGSSALRRRDEKGVPRSYRFGAVVQQGHVSALAPFDGSALIERVLLDMRTQKGMSGGPVVACSSGQVIGVHQAGIGDMVAFAVPLDQPFLASLIGIAGNLEALSTTDSQRMPNVTVPTVRRRMAD